MKLSIIMSAYNAGSTIERAVQSICTQSFTDWELIIVNDASTDNTREIAESFANEKIRVVNLEENKGAGIARGTGIAMARGEYVATIDSDDWIETGHFRLLFECAEENNADIAWGGVVVHQPDGSTSSNTPRIFCGKGFDILREFFGQQTMFMNNMIIRRSLFRKIPYSRRRYVEDTPTLVPILFSAGRVATVPCATYHYMQYEKSLCHTSSNWKTSLYCGLCILDIWDWFCNNGYRFACDQLDLRKNLEREFKEVFEFDVSREDAMANYMEWAEFTLRASSLIKVEKISFKK